jgi:hypothetical protein
MLTMKAIPLSFFEILPRPPPRCLCWTPTAMQLMGPSLCGSPPLPLLALLPPAALLPLRFLSVRTQPCRTPPFLRPLPPHPHLFLFLLRQRPLSPLARRCRPTVLLPLPNLKKLLSPPLPRHMSRTLQTRRRVSTRVRTMLLLLMPSPSPTTAAKTSLRAKAAPCLTLSAALSLILSARQVASAQAYQGRSSRECLSEGDM